MPESSHCWNSRWPRNLQRRSLRLSAFGDFRARFHHCRNRDGCAASSAPAQAPRAPRFARTWPQREHLRQRLRRHLHRVLHGQFRRGFHRQSCRPEDGAERFPRPDFCRNRSIRRRVHYQCDDRSGDDDWHRKSSCHCHSTRSAVGCLEEVQPPESLTARDSANPIAVCGRKRRGAVSPVVSLYYFCETHRSPHPCLLCAVYGRALHSRRVFRARKQANSHYERYSD